ncbi:MAG: protein translocase subunit SecF [Eubacteriales bacterium]|nr:protein translocase subunit SecF [Eubacteriales bacterium]
MRLEEKLRNTKFNFVRNGRWFFIAPGVILLIGIIMLAVLGFNLGLEFTGGTIVTVSADGAHTKTEITEKMSSYDVKYSINEEQNTSGGTNYSIKFNATDETEEIIKDLQTYFNTEDWISTDTIQASTTSETILGVFWSILAALAGLIIYMLIRFKFTAGIATILALAHDVLMICALMAIFQIEINASFIAAILTVMAYSINNSLVVFDRVRSYEKNNTNNDTVEQIINRSITRTLGRSILTVGTTLATLMVLTIISLVMNLSSLIEFALPIIFGLFAGTYSSLFLIGPLYKQFETARLYAKQRKIVKAQ